MTTQPATWDPAMDDAALLERVFEHQRAAERLLDEACAAEGSGAYEIPSGMAGDSAAAAYTSAAAELRAAAGLLEYLAAR